MAKKTVKKSAARRTRVIVPKGDARTPKVPAPRQTKKVTVDPTAYVDTGVVPRKDKTKSGKPRTRPTGFKTGNPGRPTGAKDKVPRSVKASMKQLFEDVARDKQKTLKTALMRGIQSGPRHADRYLKLIAEYVDGKPTDTLNLNQSLNEEQLKEVGETLGKKMTAMVAALRRSRQESES